MTFADKPPPEQTSEPLLATPLPPRMRGGSPHSPLRIISLLHRKRSIFSSANETDAGSTGREAKPGKTCSTTSGCPTIECASTSETRHCRSSHSNGSTNCKLRVFSKRGAVQDALPFRSHVSLADRWSSAVGGSPFPPRWQPKLVRDEENTRGNFTKIRPRSSRDRRHIPEFLSQAWSLLH
jgi:hypothetical protein